MNAPDSLRLKAGLCRACGTRPRVFRSARCSICRVERRRHLGTEWSRRAMQDQTRREAANRRKRERYERQDSFRARVAKANGGRIRTRDDGDRLYHKIWMRLARRDPAWNAAYTARRREIAAAKREAIRAGCPVSDWRRFDPRRTADPSVPSSQRAA